MPRIKSIAITGKGGTGKTMLATLIIRLLSRRFARVLAIDADSAVSLPYTLGLPVEKTVSDLRKTVIGQSQLQKQAGDQPTRAIMEGLLAHGQGFDLLAMGRPEEPGCFCAVNDLLRYGIDALIDSYDIAIIDGEAGPEQLNRRVLKSIDILLVVADMSARSLETAAGIIEVAQRQDGDSGVRVGKAGLVLNRVRDDRPDQALLRKVGVEVAGWIPEDKMLNDYDRAGQSLLRLPAESACLKAVQQLLDKILPAA
jgi:CO dehydrogenase maturation factor